MIGNFADSIIDDYINEVTNYFLSKNIKEVVVLFTADDFNKYKNKNTENILFVGYGDPAYYFNLPCEYDNKKGKYIPEVNFVNLQYAEYKTFDDLAYMLFSAEKYKDVVYNGLFDIVAFFRENGKLEYVLNNRKEAEKYIKKLVDFFNQSADYQVPF